MTIIVCIDNDLGMMFNKRRTSYDRQVTADILRDASASRLFIAPYSERLFGDLAEGVMLGAKPLCEAKDELEKLLVVTDDPLGEAGDGDLVFVEGLACLPYLDKIDTIITYCWNTWYPRDFSFDIDTEKAGFKLCESLDFPGWSHELITKNIYRR